MRSSAASRGGMPVPKSLRTQNRHHPVGPRFLRIFVCRREKAARAPTNLWLKVDCFGGFPSRKTRVSAAAPESAGLLA